MPETHKWQLLARLSRRSYMAGRLTFPHHGVAVAGARATIYWDKGCFDNYCLANGPYAMTMPAPHRPARAALRFPGAGGVPQPVADLRPPALRGRAVRPFDLTPQQYNALRLLRGRAAGQIRTLDLAARLVSRAPDITRLLDKLEQRGLIDRDRPADNRRVVRVGITAAGLALLDELARAAAPVPRPAARPPVAEGLKDLIALLRAARLPHEDAASSWH